MRYEDFKLAIAKQLQSQPDGMTWAELKAGAGLPYKTPCYTWVYRLEAEVGLVRTKSSRGMIWRLS